jgi:hypothetical protein
MAPAAEPTDVLFQRPCNDLHMKLNQLKNPKKYVEAFDPDILVLDIVETLYRDYQTKLAELMDVIPNDQFEEFDILYTTTIIKIKRQKIDHGPSEESENTGEQKPEVTTKIKLPDIPLPVFSGNLNEWVYFRDKFRGAHHRQRSVERCTKTSLLAELAEAETLE